MRTELLFPSSSSPPRLAHRESLPRKDPRPLLCRTFHRIPRSTSSPDLIFSTYVLNVAVGGSQQFPLQLDTGSSDLVCPPLPLFPQSQLTQIQWIASTSCTTCDSAGNRLYDPSGSLDAGEHFEINYIAGGAAGPIVWDKVSIGGYTILHQALGMPDLTRSSPQRPHPEPLAAAGEVKDEPLDAFSGILGLAFPLNSVITSKLRAGDPVGADGATWASNLFGMDGAPDSRFVSILLERPGSTKVPSLLGIGRHPVDLVPDPSKIHYSNILSEGNGAMFWKISVTAITVYVDGVRKDINIGPSNSGSAFPTAVLDTGVPVILATSDIANGIYGALDIHPARDGSCE